MEDLLQVNNLRKKFLYNYIEHLHEFDIFTYFNNYLFNYWLI